jgi:hypothetical protein
MVTVGALLPPPSDVVVAISHTAMPTMAPSGALRPGALARSATPLWPMADLGLGSEGGAVVGQDGFQSEPPVAYNKHTDWAGSGRLTLVIRRAGFR